MKTFTTKQTALILIIILLTGMWGCRSGKKTTRNVLGSRIEMPCDESKSKSDGNYIRASQIARSSDITMAREKAFLVTQDRLMTMIESYLRATTRRYANEKGITGSYESGEVFETMILRSVNSKVNMLNIICEESFLNDNGIYATAMTLEVEKAQILNVIEDELKNDKYLELRYDMERFKEIFEEESLRPFSR